jgi:hypothetical protein
LNQGVSFLAERQCHVPVTEQIDYVWVLDSDVVVLRPDTVHMAIARLRGERAAALGPPAWYASHQREMLSIYSLLLDPAVVWRGPFPPFREAGEPSAALQLGLLGSDLGLASFGFVEDGYLLHVGRGTLAEVAKAGTKQNRYLTWALEHNEPHFSGASSAPAVYAEFLEAFDREVGEATADSLIRACRASTPLTSLGRA